MVSSFDPPRSAVLVADSERSPGWVVRDPYLAGVVAEPCRCRPTPTLGARPLGFGLMSELNAMENQPRAGKLWDFGGPGGSDFSGQDPRYLSPAGGPLTFLGARR